MQAMCVVGARPNFMKIKPIIDALDRSGVRTQLVHTGQHYDADMSDIFFADLGLRKPDYYLGVGSGTQAQQTARVLIKFEPLLASASPDVVVVVGDVNSTLACALVAAKSRALVAHVEAGLRSRDWTMPEEVNRVVADRLSDFLLAPSPDAVVNLEGEGYRRDQIHLVGNVMVDTLLANLERARAGDTLRRLGLQEGRYGLVTLHRPGTVDQPTALSEVMKALIAISADLPLVFPVHPRTQAALAGFPNSGLVLIPPAGYLDFIALEAGAAVVLTDSGGVQEETTVLGVPCLTIRDNTERPITVAEGTNTVVGRRAAGIVEAAQRVLTEGAAKRRPALWDGHAGERIAAVLVKGILDPPSRPTEL